jgi:hypothetical protein
MSKVTKSSKNIRPIALDKGFTLISEKYQDIAFILLIAFSVFLFFAGVIFSHEIAVSDNFASISFRNYLHDASKSGEFPLWIPNIFCGMPSYSSLLITGDRLWDIIPEIVFGYTRLIGNIFGNDSARVIQFYILFGIGMYLLMRSKKHTPMVAFFTAIAAVFSTGIIHWVMIGHNTKPIAMAILPFIFLLMERVREKFTLLYSALLVYAIHLMFESAHVQMMFYSALAIGIYILFELISRLVSKRDPMSVVRLIGVLAVAGGIAYGMSSDRYFAVMEYTKYSVRGSAPIVDEKGKKTTDETGGNSYEYASEWSFSPQEIITFLVPNYYGFGKLPYKGPATRNEEMKVPTYWGQKIFEDVAPYMGIIVFFLGIIGFIANRKDVFVQALMAVSVFVLILSFGKNLSVLYDIFFYYVPSFNKFRAPSMALAMMQFSFPILAGFGLSSIFKWVKETTVSDKKLMTTLLSSAGGFLLLGFIFAVVGKGFYIDALTNSSNGSFQNVASQVPDLKEFIWSAMISDWMIIGFIFAAFAVLTYYFVKSKINTNAYFLSIIFLLFFDLWRVGWRPLEISKTDQVKEVFQKTDVIDFLQKDKERFRIADFAMAGISPNLPAYFKLENVGGYHPAKLRVYQDMLDVADQGSTSQVTNIFLWNMMNVKYVITEKPLPNSQAIFQSQQTGWNVYQNPQMLPRLFFVDSIGVEKPLEILKMMKTGSFNPQKVAFMEKKINQSIVPATPEAKAEIVEYKNENIKIKAKATGNNLLFISEIYFPLWKAYLDGKEIEIYKTNYAFRSVIIPAGEHSVELKYHSNGFELGRTVSIGTNILMVLLLVGGIFIERKRIKAEKIK